MAENSNHEKMFINTETNDKNEMKKFLVEELGGTVVPLETSDEINVLDTGIPFPLKETIENNKKKAEEICRIATESFRK